MLVFFKNTKILEPPISIDDLLPNIISNDYKTFYLSGGENGEKIDVHDLCYCNVAWIMETVEKANRYDGLFLVITKED